MWDSLVLAPFSLVMPWPGRAQSWHISPDVPCALGLVRYKVPPGIKIMEYMKILVLECSQALCCWDFQRPPEEQDPEFQAGAALQLFQRLTLLFSLQFASFLGCLLKLWNLLRAMVTQTITTWAEIICLDWILFWVGKGSSDLWDPVKSGYQCEIQCNFDFGTWLKIINYPKCLTLYIPLISKAYQDFSIHALFKKWGK